MQKTENATNTTYEQDGVAIQVVIDPEGDTIYEILDGYTTTPVVSLDDYQVDILIRLLKQAQEDSK